MPVPDWSRVEDWDVLRLGGQVMPGVAQVTVDLGSGLDVKKPKGARRATIRDEGAPPATLRVEIELLHGEMAAFESVKKLLRPRSVDGAREPLEISHPQAQLWGINVVTVGEVSAPMPSRGGTYLVSFTCVEWAPAPTRVKKAKKSPTTSGSGGNGKSAAELADENAQASLPREPESVGANFSDPNQLYSYDPDAA